MPRFPKVPSSPDFLLYTPYVPPIEPTPVPSTPPTKKDQLVIALTWSDGVRKFNPRAVDRKVRIASDFTPIDGHDVKTREWLRRTTKWPAKLADPLFRSKVGEGQCMIFELPDGYTLYERVHFPDKGKGHPMKHTYLFGHPSGGTFRSPKEFQAHYLWMACDPMKDRKNCACKLCGNATAKE
ncbi:unnamed protein product [Tuber aestivum]|uniref:Cryptic loci regulator 2 N-terminal domain-containing protein n=1 Tax=Tuber aestivum TaxID=59557 RepID=A0A292Q2M4_9PEZI|nr:unnamed protein product [Tuber aestivum]